MARDRIRIGCGAGFADDRIPPGVEIVERGELDYLAMECLAERTIARETLDRAKDPDEGLHAGAVGAHGGDHAAGAAAWRPDRHQHGRGQPDGRGARAAQARARLGLPRL